MKTVYSSEMRGKPPLANPVTHAQILLSLTLGLLVGSTQDYIISKAKKRLN